MVKILLIIFVTIVVFTGALYLGIFGMLGDYITVINNDFMPFIPMELRLAFFMIILGLIIALWKSFID